MAHLFSFDTIRARFHPLRDIFAARFMSQEISLLTAFYCASVHLSRLAGSWPSREALWREAAVCRSLNKRLSSVRTQADDFSIMGVLGMICVEVEIRPQVCCSSGDFTWGADRCRTIRQREGCDYQATSEACVG